MSNIIYFTENKTKGVQVSAELLDMLQTTEKTLEQAFVCMMGNNGIVCGCNNLGGGIYAEGLIIWNNELFVFKGGPLGAYIIVDSVTTQCTFCSGDVERIWTVKTAKFAASIPGDGTGIAVTADLPEFYHPEYTFFTLDAQVVQNTEDITNLDQRIDSIEANVIINEEDITNLQQLLDSFSALYTLQQNQIDYLTAHLFDCCETPPAVDTTFDGTTIDLCSEEIQGRITYTLNLVAPGVSGFSVTQKILEVPTATPSVVSSVTLSNMIVPPPVPHNMREEIADVANTNNKFKLQIQYTQSAVVKTGLLVFSLPNFSMDTDSCVEDIAVTFYPTYF
jgi:uncharacterized coiled-coil protein SlyX